MISLRTKGIMMKAMAMERIRNMIMLNIIQQDLASIRIEIYEKVSIRIKIFEMATIEIFLMTGTENIEDRNNDMNLMDIMTHTSGNIQRRNYMVRKKKKTRTEIKTKRRNEKRNEEDNRKVQSFSKINVKADQCLLPKK